MTNVQAVTQRTKVTFKLVCFILAAYMTFTQIQHYFENHDASFIRFHRFNERTIDKYPTFTFCFSVDGSGSRPGRSIDDDGIYSEAVTEVHMTKQDYSNLLKGLNGSTEKSTENSKKIVGLDNEMFTMKLEMFLEAFNFRAKPETKTINYHKRADKNKRVQKIQSGFYVSHQDPDQICFTRKSEMETNSFRKEDEVSVNLKQLIKWLGYSGLFRIYIHHPEQFTRSMDKPVFEAIVQELSINMGFNMQA